MKKLLSLLLSMTILAGIAGCSKGTGSTDNSSDGLEPMPAGQELAVGVSYRRPDGNTSQLWTFCGSDNKITDCGTNANVPKFNEDYYVGMTYTDAFEDFYYLVSDGDLSTFVSMEIIVCDELYDREPVIKNCEKVRDTVLPGTELGSISETKKAFTDTIAQSRSNYQQNGTFVDHGNDGDPMSPEMAEITDQASFDKALEENQNPDNANIALGKDGITLDVSKVNCNVTIQCNGHDITINGMTSNDYTVVLFGAGRIDLSGITFPAEKAVGEGEDHHDYIRWHDTMFDQVTLPNDVPDRLELGQSAGAFDTVFGFEFSAEGDMGSIGISGPRDSYDVVHQRDIETVKTILATGTTDGIEGDGKIWTDVEIDVGEIVLPEQMRADITLGKGAHLKLTGTITVTAERLRFSVVEPDQLDISGLYIVKECMSPDIIKISHPQDMAINRDMVTISGGEGGESGENKVIYSFDNDSVSITIW